MRAHLTALLASGVALAAALPPALAAEPPSCHCFRDRTFDPVSPAAADPYILATTRNSLLSAAFGISKREIVQAEMSGTSPEDLWIAHWAAARAGRDAEVLLGSKRREGGWRPALSDVERGRLGAAFEEALARGAPDVGLASVAADDVVVTRLGLDAATIAALRRTGASSQEVIVAAVLSRRGRVNPAELYASVKSRKKTWGVLLQEAGIAPAEMDALVRKSVR